jgi:hypothetical protein
VLHGRPGGSQGHVEAQPLLVLTHCGIEDRQIQLQPAVQPGATVVVVVVQFAPE